MGIGGGGAVDVDSKRRSNEFGQCYVFFVIVVAAADRGQDQRRIGFIDVVNDGVDPMGIGGGGAVDVDSKRRSYEFGRCYVFFGGGEKERKSKAYWVH